MKKVKLIVILEIQRNNHKIGKVRSRKMVFYICKHKKTQLKSYIFRNSRKSDILKRLKIHSMIQNCKYQAQNLIIKIKIGQIQQK